MSQEKLPEKGASLPGVAFCMFISTLLVCYAIAYIAVLIHMQDHMSWLGTPNARELSWAINTFFGLATLYPIIALIYGFIQISNGATKNFVDANGGEQLSDEEAQMFRNFAEQVPEYTKNFKVENIRKYTSTDVNAWALGSGENSYMSFSTATLSLPEHEIKGIFLHELGHIHYGDTDRMAFARAFQNAVVAFALITPLKNFFKYTFFFMSQLVLMKVSREREFRADGFAAHLDETRGITLALKTIKESDFEPVDKENMDVYMFSFKKSLDSAFSSHPPIDFRIQRLTEYSEVSTATGT